MLLATLLILYAYLLSYLIGRMIYAWLPATVLPNGTHPSLAVFIGLTALAWTTGVVHLFLPVAWWLHFPLWLILMFHFRSLRNWLLDLRQHIATNAWLYLFLLVAGLLSILRRPGVGDIADYHLQAIQWAERYPNIPGIGNFNRPLANNNWWFNLQALFGFREITMQTVYVGNALLFMVVSAWFFTTTSVNEQHTRFRMVVQAFVLFTMLAPFVGAVTADYLVTLLILLLADMFLMQQWNNTDNAWWMILLTLLAVTAKATALSFFLLLLPWVIAVLNNKNYQLIYVSVLVVLLYLLPWLIGNVVVSGYLLYPFHEVDLFNVDWKLPSSLPAMEREIVKYWGRIPEQEIQVTKLLSFGAWFPVWFGKLDLMNKALLLFGVLGALLSVGNLKKFWGLLLFLITGAAIVFMNGPHPRFLFGYLVAFTAFGFSCLPIGNIQKVLLPQRLSLLLIVMFVLVLWTNRERLSQNFSWWAPSAYTSEALTDQSINGWNFKYDAQGRHCWDCFPCTYYLSDSIELRGPEITSGFRSTRK